MRDPVNKLKSRSLKVLEAVICGYLATGRPVGSRTVVRHFNLGCSPATVRNEMADLAEMGYLKKAHISSGRIPTDVGIRFYLDYLMMEDQLAPEELERFRNSYHVVDEDFKGMVRGVGRVLADLTHQAVAVMTPGLRCLPLRHVEFTRLTSKRVMALLISEWGRFQTRVFEWGEDLKHRDLIWASNYLNDRFQGKTLRQIREIIIEDIQEKQAEYDKMLGRALGLMETVLQQDQLDEEVFIEGRENLVDKPEFAQSNKMARLLKVLEEKNFVVGLLSQALDDSDPLVLLSTETGMEDVPEIAVILARYKTGGQGDGTVGIIGPMRMNYSRVIPMVRYTARYVSDLLGS